MSEIGYIREQCTSMPYGAVSRPLYRLLPLDKFYSIEVWAGTYWKQVSVYQRLFDAHADLQLRLLTEIGAKAFCAVHGSRMDYETPEPCPGCAAQFYADRGYGMGFVIAGVLLSISMLFAERFGWVGYRAYLYRTFTGEK